MLLTSVWLACLLACLLACPLLSLLSGVLFQPNEAVQETLASLFETGLLPGAQELMARPDKQADLVMMIVPLVLEEE